MPLKRKLLRLPKQLTGLELKLIKLRSEMDMLDQELMEILIRRFKKTEQILKFKSKLKTPRKDKKREQEILKKQIKYLKQKKSLKYKRQFKKIYQLILGFTK